MTAAELLRALLQLCFVIRTGDMEAIKEAGEKAERLISVEAA